MLALMPGFAENKLTGIGPEGNRLQWYFVPH